MDKKIEKLNNHYIVCGADQTGRYVIDELLKTNRDFVVIEKDPEKIQRFIDSDILCIQGDATHDAVLLAAGIDKAKGFITSLNTDADNLMAVVTAKRLNADMRVISKAIEEESEQKIKLAGADSVVLPNFIGGLRMVSEVVRPSVVTFLDAMLRDKKDTIRIENITIKPGSAFAGKTLQETGLSSRAGISIVAIMDKQGGDYLINPSQDTIVHENNILIVMGKVEIINELRGAAR